MKKLIGITLMLTMLVALMVIINNSNDNFSRRNNESRIILTSLKPVCSLASALSEGTGITVQNVFHKGMKMEEQNRWFDKNSEFFSLTAIKSVAVISLGSVWQNDPLYPYTRRFNIRVINIDSAEPIDPHLAGVSKIEAPRDISSEKIYSRTQIGESTTEISPFVWLSMSNGAKMAELISLDMQMISPEDKEIIKENHNNLKNRIFELKTKYEVAFSEADAYSVLTLSPDFVYLTDNFNIYVAEYMLKDGYYWKEEDLLSLKNAIIDYNTSVIISHFEPNEKIKNVINETGAHLVILDNMDTIGILENPESYYLEVMDANLAKLLQAFRDIPE